MAYRFLLLLLLAIASPTASIAQEERVTMGTCVYLPSEWTKWTRCSAHLEQFSIIDTVRWEVTGIEWRHVWRRTRSRTWDPVDARCVLTVPGIGREYKPCRKPLFKQLPPDTIAPVRYPAGLYKIE